MSVPHFNHVHDVLQALVPAAVALDARMRQDACSALSALLSSGRNEDVMLDAVQLVADLVRQRKCVCSADIVRALLVLQFKDLTKADVEKGVLLVCAAAWRLCTGRVGRGRSDAGSHYAAIQPTVRLEFLFRAGSVERVPEAAAVVIVLRRSVTRFALSSGPFACCEFETATQIWALALWRHASVCCLPCVVSRIGHACIQAHI